MAGRRVISFEGPRPRGVSSLSLDLGTKKRTTLLFFYFGIDHSQIARRHCYLMPTDASTGGRVEGGSLACVRPPGVLQQRVGLRGRDDSRPAKTRSLARACLQVRTAPQTPRGRLPVAGDCAAPPLRGPRCAALLGPC